MRWRFLDCIDFYDRWKALRGRKAVSFEEYSLLKPFGRKGAFPEPLALESCISAVRWLVLRSSEFGRIPLLSEIDRFAFDREMRAGDVLQISINIVDHAPAGVTAACVVQVNGRPTATGRLTFESVEAATMWDPEKARIVWERLYAAT